MFEDQTLKAGARVRHMETPCIRYWNSVHGTLKRTESCAQTSKIHNCIFQLIVTNMTKQGRFHMTNNY